MQQQRLPEFLETSILMTLSPYHNSYTHFGTVKVDLKSWLVSTTSFLLSNKPRLCLGRSSKIVLRLYMPTSPFDVLHTPSSAVPFLLGRALV